MRYVAPRTSEKRLTTKAYLGVTEVREGRLDLFAGSTSTIAPRVGCRTHRRGVPGLDIGALCLRPG